VNFNNSALDSKCGIFNLSTIEYTSVIIWTIRVEEEVRVVFQNDGRRLVFDLMEVLLEKRWRGESYLGLRETLSRIEDYVSCVKLFKQRSSVRPVICEYVNIKPIRDIHSRIKFTILKYFIRFIICCLKPFI
jgi:hypothetical protein